MASEDSIGGTVTVQKKPNFWLAVLLLWCCLLPGIVYLVTRRGMETEPFNIQIAAEVEGSRVSCTGQGAGYRAAYQAMRTLPEAPSVNDASPDGR